MKKLANVKTIRRVIGGGLGLGTGVVGASTFNKATTPKELAGQPRAYSDAQGNIYKNPAYTREEKRRTRNKMVGGAASAVLGAVALPKLIQKRIASGGVKDATKIKNLIDDILPKMGTESNRLANIASDPTKSMRIRRAARARETAINKDINKILSQPGSGGNFSDYFKEITKKERSARIFGGRGSTTPKSIMRDVLGVRGGTGTPFERYKQTIIAKNPTGLV